MLSKGRIDCGWSKGEFWAIDFNDKRLTNRFIKLSEAFLNQPSVSINQACEDWSDTKAAYRLFDNEKVTPQEILRVHQTRTQERIRDYPLVLAIQDTTYLDYTHHQQIPTVQQVVRWIAQLGGFLGRKRDKEPGVTVIWRG